MNLGFTKTFSRDFVNLILLALLVYLCAFGSTGYQYSIVNVPKPLIQKFVNETMAARFGVQLDRTYMAVVFSFIVACQGFGSLIGATVGRDLAERIGRKWTVMGVQSACLILGSFLCMLALPTGLFEMIMLGRFVIGMSTGLVLATVSMFMLECTPVSYRGIMGSLGSLFTLVGDAVARAIGSVATETSWSYVLGATILPGIILLCAAPFFQESPKFLLLKLQNMDRGKNSVSFYFGENRKESRTEKILTEESTRRKITVVTVGDMFKQEVFRTPMLIAVSINAAAAAGGLFAVFAYSSTIFEHLRLPDSTKRAFSQVLIPVNVATGIAQMFLVHRVRRRPLILISIGVVIICHCVFLVMASIDYYVDDTSAPAYIASLSLMVAIVFINLGVASVSLFLPAEISLLPARPMTATIGAITRSTGTLITQLCFGTLYEVIRQFSFIFFIVFSGIFLAYLYIELPETKGRSLDNITSRWRKMSAKIIPVPFPIDLVAIAEAQGKTEGQTKAEDIHIIKEEPEMEEAAMRTESNVATIEEAAMRTESNIATIEEAAMRTASNIATIEEAAMRTASNIATIEEAAMRTASNIATIEEAAMRTASNIATIEEGSQEDNTDATFTHL